jgi:hypothetical protein
VCQCLLDVIAARPGTRCVPSIDGQIEQTYRRLLEQIDA